MTSEQLEQRGKDLRAAVQQIYQKLGKSGELRTDIHGTDITAIVLTYIPLGTSFGDAETNTARCRVWH
ncbi:MAG TPA: hypothetical protein VFT69_19085 [Pseudolabrys sp.]|nr:hypothetical protein [Pseudolabrys sp.]